MRLLLIAVAPLVLAASGLPAWAQNSTAAGAANGAAAGEAAAGQIGRVVGGVTGAAVGTAAGIADAVLGTAPGPTTVKRTTCVTQPNGSRRCDSVETTN